VGYRKIQNRLSAHNYHHLIQKILRTNDKVESYGGKGKGKKKEVMIPCLQETLGEKKKKAE